jgi:hypothetical protein
MAYGRKMTAEYGIFLSQPSMYFVHAALEMCLQNPSAFQEIPVFLLPFPKGLRSRRKECGLDIPPICAVAS